MVNGRPFAVALERDTERRANAKNKAAAPYGAAASVRWTGLFLLILVLFFALILAFVTLASSL